MKRFIPGILLASCSSPPEPPPVTTPGDEQARAWEPVPCEVQCADGYEVRDYTGETRESIAVKASCVRVVGGQVDGGRLAVVGREYGTWQDIPAELAGASDYVATVRDRANNCVEIIGTRVNGRVVVGMGVSDVTFRDVHVSGYSSSTSVYYRAEGWGIHWIGGSIDCSLAARDACVAVDATASGSFVGVKFTGRYIGYAIESYRNQTEGGVPRIETPRDWLVEDCTFDRFKSGIFLGSRDSDIRDYWWDSYDPDGVGSEATPYAYARRWTIIGESGGIRKGKSTGRVETR